MKPSELKYWTTKFIISDMLNCVRSIKGAQCDLNITLQVSKITDKFIYISIISISCISYMCIK